MGRYDDLPELANELDGLRVNAIFTAGGSPSAVAAKDSYYNDPDRVPGDDPNFGFRFVAREGNGPDDPRRALATAEPSCWIS